MCVLLLRRLQEYTSHPVEAMATHAAHSLEASAGGGGGGGGGARAAA